MALRVTQREINKQYYIFYSSGDEVLKFLKNQMKLVAKTLYGLEKVLAAELETLGATGIIPVNRAVIFDGSKELIYKVNYCSRTALSVLMPVYEFVIRSKEDLYKRASSFNWSSVMNADTSFSIVPVINSKLFTHTGYPALIVKDAIADHFRKKTGKRPSVDTVDPMLLINLHISENSVTVSLDSTVVPLYKRGYRAEQGMAPLNEVLAAGILMLSGWTDKYPLTDPMCGSGTILIEARLMADRIPPGKFRNFFGFTRWKDFDQALFETVKKKSDSRIHRSEVVINGSDISEEAVKQAIANINKAGLSDDISVKGCDFKDLKVEGHNGFLVFNPPYGQRLVPDDMVNLYSMIGTTLKYNFAGSRAWIITSGKEYVKYIGLKPKAKFILFNGALECLLSGYEMYEGTRKLKES
jgi:putative N6-adenine-specific DNA methylase